ncbi:TPA: integrase core domain-containing protein, partial [Legionella pneumophila]
GFWDFAKHTGFRPKVCQPYSDMYAFKNLQEVRELTENWIKEYNDERPHDSLNDLTPWEYLAKNKTMNSNLGCH